MLQNLQSCLSHVQSSTAAVAAAIGVLVPLTVITCVTILCCYCYIRNKRKSRQSTRDTRTVPVSRSVVRTTTSSSSPHSTITPSPTVPTVAPDISTQPAYNMSSYPSHSVAHAHSNKHYPPSYTKGPSDKEEPRNELYPDAPPAYSEVAFYPAAGLPDTQ